jgi:hypothetical protein
MSSPHYAYAPANQPGSAGHWPNWIKRPGGWAAFPIPLRRIALADDQMPMFVTFTDFNNPKTLLRVTPERFESIPGTGIKLKAVYVETTRDPTTRSMAKHLPWLNTWPRGMQLLGGSRDADTFVGSNIPFDLSGKG